MVEDTLFPDTNLVAYKHPGVIDERYAEALFSFIINLPRVDRESKTVGCLLVVNKDGDSCVRIYGKSDSIEEQLSVVDALNKKIESLTETPNEEQLIIFTGFPDEISEAFEILYRLGSSVRPLNTEVEPYISKAVEGIDNEYLGKNDGKCDIRFQAMVWLNEREALIKKYASVKKNCDNCQAMYLLDKELLKYFEF